MSDALTAPENAAPPPPVVIPPVIHVPSVFRPNGAVSPKVLVVRQTRDAGTSQRVLDTLRGLPKTPENFCPVCFDVVRWVAAPAAASDWRRCPVCGLLRMHSAGALIDPRPAPPSRWRCNIQRARSEWLRALLRVTFPDRSRRKLLVVSGTPAFEDGGIQEQSVSVVRLCSSMLLSLALETETLKPESLDGAMLFLALETFTQPHLALAALHSLLRPQAKLFVEFADASRWRALLMGGHWPGIQLPAQRFCYRAAHVRKILAKSGFRVDRAANGASPSDFLSPVAAGGGGWIQTAARMFAWGSCTLMQTTRCGIGFSE